VFILLYLLQVFIQKRSSLRRLGKYKYQVKMSQQLMLSTAESLACVLLGNTVQIMDSAYVGKFRIILFDVKETAV